MRVSSRVPSLVALVTVSVFAMAGCAAGSAPEPSPAVAGRTPESTANVHPGASACPAEVNVDSPPERVVTLDGSAAAFLIELGVGDRIVGTAGIDFIQDFGGPLRADLDSIPVLDEAQGNQEAVLHAQPDFVTGISPYQFGGFEGSATVETLQENGISALGACGAIAEGENVTLDAMYTYVGELGKAFGVEEKADELISELTARVDELVSDAEPVSALVLTAVPDDGTGIRTRGGTSFANALVHLAGGRSLAADMSGDSVELSAERVAVDNPSVIVAVSGFSAQSSEEMESAILTSPLLASTDAVKNGDVIVVPQRVLLSPSLLNVDAIEVLAAAFDRAR